jgi:hypothetical protein
MGVCVVVLVHELSAIHIAAQTPQFTFELHLSSSRVDTTLCAAALNIVRISLYFFYYCALMDIWISVRTAAPRAAVPFVVAGANLAT